MPAQKLVNNCCGAFSLRSGSYVIGILNIFGSFIAAPDPTEGSSPLGNPLYLLNAFAAIGLVYGIYAKNVALIEVYLVFNTLSLITLAAALLIYPFILFKSFQDPLIAAVWSSGMMALLINIYCFAVVYSYYVELKEEEGIEDD